MKLSLPQIKLLDEFKAFAFKGNMIDLAVAVVIGGAFGKVVDAMVRYIIMPLVSYVTPSRGYETWHLGKIAIGSFLGELVNFLIVAAAVFLIIVKLVGIMMKKVVPAAPPAAPSEPTMKECPLCCSTIPIKARKCPHCTADLPA